MQGAVDGSDGPLHGGEISRICTADRLPEVPLRHPAQVVGYILRHLVEAENRCLQRPCQLGGLIPGRDRGRRGVQIPVRQLLQPGNAGLNGVGDGPAHQHRNGEGGQNNQDHHQNGEQDAPVQGGLELPLAGLDGDAPALIALDGGKAHQFVVAVEVVGAEAGFPLDHALVHCGHVRHAGVRLGGRDQVGALRHNGAIRVADDVALVVQHIGHAAAAHG